MLYNGALDLSCNHLGILHALEANTWSGRSLYFVFFFIHYSPWSNSIRSLTKYKDDVVGQHYLLGNLSFYILRDAGSSSFYQFQNLILLGHLAPMDLPGPSLDMVKRFIHDQSFADIVLPPDCIENLNSLLIFHSILYNTES